MKSKFIAFALIFSLFSSIHAQEEEWEYTIAPYLFALNIEGETATLPGADPAELEVDFDELLEDLDGALMGQFEARKGKFAIVSDIFFSRISSEGETPGALFGENSYEQDLFYLNLSASYRVLEGNKGNLDLMAGVRYSHLDNTLELDAGLAPAQKLEDKEDWFDPFFTVKGNLLLADKLYLISWAGFAVGGDSDETIDLFAGLGYNFSETMSFVTGYRHMSIDYEKDGYLWDVEMTGMLFGLVIKL